MIGLIWPYSILAQSIVARQWERYMSLNIDRAGRNPEEEKLQTGWSSQKVSTLNPDCAFSSLKLMFSGRNVVGSKGRRI